MIKISTFTSNIPFVTLAQHEPSHSEVLELKIGGQVLFLVAQLNCWHAHLEMRPAMKEYEERVIAWKEESRKYGGAIEIVFEKDDMKKGVDLLMRNLFVNDSTS